MLKKEVLEMREETDKIHKEIKQEETLAINLLKEIKQSAKRWFVISIILLVALFSSNCGWLLYESQFETIVEGETTTIETGNGITTYIENSISGDIEYGKNYKNQI